MLTRTHVAVVAVLAAVAALLSPAAPASAAPVTVTNAVQFKDTAGNPVHAHGGGLLKHGSYYYWFGENRNADNTFRAVSVYRSTDLKTWEFRRDVLTRSSAAELQVANIERPKVIYNASTGQFVMWMHKENGVDYGEARAAVAVSSTVDGDYTYRGSFRPLGTHMSRDITTFVDTDGTGYMISAANENYDLHVYRLTADYTNTAALVRSWPGDHREAPALFKRNGVYFMLTSAATGWNPNQAQYSTATSITGTWSAWQNTGDNVTFGSQSTYVQQVGNAFLYLGDRWGNSIGGTVNDSQYVWLPIAFPSSTSMSLTYAPELSIDVASGTVSGLTSGYASLAARHSGKCADILNGSSANNAEAVQYTCGTGFNQQFYLKNLGNGYVQIQVRHSARCLDVTSGNTADGARVIQYACGLGTNQQWQVQDAGSGYVRLIARHSGRCLDVISASTSDSARLAQYSCNGGTNQQWLRRTP
ncbi:RICIN domain-containing protein [Catenuloplanes sp. NPDC051500]|uniref:RICIN domain-containing protein n=1 Tax=Catenuloplanes sp. NPDC051500 TaxID=3363959 RepID=UPI0037A4499E